MRDSSLNLPQYTISEVSTMYLIFCRVRIVSQKETPTGWEFVVDIEEITFNVTMDQRFWQKLTKGDEQPEQLVKRSFEFLLSREPKESILREFDLRVIQTYFPEYKDEIKII